MLRGRVSIARLMIVVALLALDLALLRFWIAIVGSEGLGLITVLWPLRLVSLILTRGRLRRFFVGSSISCPAALIAYGVSIDMFPDTLGTLFSSGINALVRIMPLEPLRNAMQQEEAGDIPFLLRLLV